MFSIWTLVPKNDAVNIPLLTPTVNAPLFSLHTKAPHKGDTKQLPCNLFPEEVS